MRCTRMHKGIDTVSVCVHVWVYETFITSIAKNKLQNKQKHENILDIFRSLCVVVPMRLSEQQQE